MPATLKTPYFGTTNLTGGGGSAPPAGSVTQAYVDSGDSANAASIAAEAARATAAEEQLAEDIAAIDGYTLPPAGLTTLGGVKRNVGSAGQFVTGIDADGNLERDTPEGGGSTPTPLGTIFEQSNWTNLTNYTANGTTPTPTTGKLVFNGGAGTLDKSLDRDYRTCLENWTQTIEIEAGTVDSTSYGLAIGTRSYHPDTVQRYDLNVQLGMHDDLLDGGKIFIRFNSTVVASSSSQLVFAGGDKIRMILERRGNIVTARASNITTQSAEIATTYIFPLTTGSTNYLPNDGCPAIFNLGGTQTVTYWKFHTTEKTNGDMVIVGDSKTVGYFAGDYAEVWAQRLKLDFSSVVLAGGSSRISTAIDRLPEILSFNSRRALMAIGSNDKRDGVADATTLANYDTLVSSIEAGGVEVWHFLPFFESSLDQSALNSHIIATYPAGRVIDSKLVDYSGTTSNILDADGVHPNGVGNDLIYRAASQAIH